MSIVYSRHHIVPTSRNGSSINENIICIDNRRHQALHMLFDNKTPAEQIRKILDISSTALTEQFIYTVRDILRSPD